MNKYRRTKLDKNDKYRHLYLMYTILFQYYPFMQDNFARVGARPALRPSARDERVSYVQILPMFKKRIRIQINKTKSLKQKLFLFAYWHN